MELTSAYVIARPLQSILADSSSLLLLQDIHTLNTSINTNDAIIKVAGDILTKLFFILIYFKILFFRICPIPFNNGEIFPKLFFRFYPVVP